MSGSADDSLLVAMLSTVSGSCCTCWDRDNGTQMSDHIRPHNATAATLLQQSGVQKACTAIRHCCGKSTTTNHYIERCKRVA